LCDIFKLLKNVINFLLGITITFAGGFVVWGGLEIMFSGGEKGITSGKERITTAVMGIVIALGSWLFIGTLLQVLTNSPSALPWNTIQCSSKGLGSGTATGNDSACTALKGECRDRAITTCDGTWTAGKCLSSSNANYQCCIPK
jgi:hypothetical protein